MATYKIELIIELNEEPSGTWIPDAVAECLEDNEQIIKWCWDDAEEVQP